MTSNITATYILTVLLFIAFDASAKGTLKTLRVKELQREYFTDPLGINSKTPSYSWKLSDKNNTRYQKQTAYQVLIASNKSLLDKDQADIWESGKVVSMQSALIPFGGKELVSGQDYYWKVRAFDQARKPSNWSAIARFSMCLLRTEVWTGSWITHPTAPEEKHIWYRRTFTFSSSRILRLFMFHHWGITNFISMVKKSMTGFCAHINPVLINGCIM